VKRTLAGAARVATGAFVLFHIAAVFVAALPSVKAGLSRVSWKQPTVRHEMQSWADSLNGLGVELTREELEDHLWSVATGWQRVRDAAYRPFRGYVERVGLLQPWRLFSAADRYPTKLRIEVERAGEFETVYFARDAEHAWLREQLDDVRFRKAVYVMSWPKRRKSWRTFGEHIADRAARDFPDATRVRVGFWRYTTPTPAQARAGETPRGRRTNTRVLELEGRR
jgi:hypothetical protein